MGGNVVGRAAGSGLSSIGKGPQQPVGPAPGASYQAPAATPYAPRMPQGLPPSPLVQQIMAQQMQPLRGLEALNALRMGYLAPRAQQALPPMPAYTNPSLAYKPNMAPAQQSLGRVAISVAEQQRREAQAELDRLRAEQAQRGSE